MHDLSDAALLRRFVEENSETAFELLVERHSRLVFATCQRVVGNPSDAEEAAQATFIALALKAKRLDAARGLGGWLHRVARQVALDLRKSGARRRLRQEEALRQGALEAHPQASGDAGLHLLDEAIGKLPEKLRAAIVGHYLEGASLEELAKLHRCTPSAISMRLTRGRELLRKRLLRTGAATAALVTALLESATSGAALVPDFAGRTTRLVMAAKAGVAVTETAGLFLAAEQALNRLLFAQFKWSFAAGTLAALTLATSIVTGQLPSTTPAGEKPKPQPVASATPTATPATPATVAPPAPTPETPADPPLIAAIKNFRYRWEDLPKLKAVLDAQQGSVNQVQDAAGKTALHWTVIRGWDDFCTLLLLRGAEVDAIDHRGYTPLFEAMDRGDTCARLLLIRGASVNHTGYDGTTPLMHAIRAGHAKDVELMLWLGAKTRLENVPDEQQPLALAAASGNPEIQELVQAYDDQRSGTLQTQPATIPNFVKNAFHEAARKADFAQLEACLSNGININTPDDHGNTALARAIQAGQDEVVFYLLMLSATPNIRNERGTTPLMQTMGWFGGGLDAMRRFLILEGANPFTLRPDGFNELTWAVERDNEHGTQWLLWLGANGREATQRGTPFQLAYKGGHQRIMDVLRRNGIDEPIQPSPDPVWNLHNAVKRGDKALVLKLLAEGVAVDSPDESGDSPLIMAIGSRNVPIARLLVEKGADIAYRNPKNGLSPLYQTIIWDYSEMTEFRDELLKAGADPDTALATSGQTALMRAVWHEPTTPLKQLIAYGADLNLRDNQGRTALGNAIKDGKLKTAQYLRELGAKE